MRRAPLAITQVATIALLTLALLGCEGRITPPPTHVPPGPTPEERLVCDTERHPVVSPMRRLTPEQYGKVIASMFDGHVSPSANFPSPAAYTLSLSGFSTEPAMNVVSEQGAEELMAAAEDVAIEVAQKLNTLLPCAQSDTSEACATTFIDRYGRRAFRRPVATEERDLLLGSFRSTSAAGFTFPEAVAAMVVVMLQTPQFLYVSERSAGSLRALDDYELASRLSFLLWDSAPDDALLEAAAAGQLSSTEQLSAQATRMLADPKADSAFARLFREWLQVRPINPTDKDQAVFPQATLALTRSINASFDRFVASEARSGSLTTLITSPAVFVDATLAPFLGVSAPAAGSWERITTDRTGLLTHPAAMASLAHATESSYVYRGRVIHKRLLCQTLGAPPANAMSEFSAIGLPPSATGKEISTAVQSRGGACQACHRQLDPGGLALEVFDALGRARTQYESGRPIDASGVLVSGGTNISFTSHTELLTTLATQPLLSRCYASQVLRFALSRVDAPDDGCALQAVADALSASGGRLDAALTAYVTSDAFRYRRDP